MKRPRQPQTWNQKIKRVLEAIWQDDKVRCPNHYTLWTHGHGGYLEDINTGVRWRKGRKVQARNPRRRR